MYITTAVYQLFLISNVHISLTSLHTGIIEFFQIQEKNTISQKIHLQQTLKKFCLPSVYKICGQIVQFLIKANNPVGIVQIFDTCKSILWEHGSLYPPQIET